MNNENKADSVQLLLQLPPGTELIHKLGLGYAMGCLLIESLVVF